MGSHDDEGRAAQRGRSMHLCSDQIQWAVHWREPELKHCVASGFPCMLMLCAGVSVPSCAPSAEGLSPARMGVALKDWICFVLILKLFPSCVSQLLSAEGQTKAQILEGIWGPGSPLTRFNSLKVGGLLQVGPWSS